MAGCPTGTVAGGIMVETRASSRITGTAMDDGPRPSMRVIQMAELTRSR